MIVKPVYTTGHPGDKILVMDWETSGSSFASFEETFRLYQGISLGLIIADSQTFQPIKTLKIDVKFYPGKYQWSDEAEAIHGLTREYLMEHGLSAEDAATEVATFVLENFGTGKIVVAGQNVQFDIAATEQLLNPFKIHLNYHHIVLDTAPLGFVTIGKHRSDDIFGFFSGAQRGDHDALDDAYLCLDTLRSVREIFNDVLENV